eukprot:5193452-Prorocentrum_lima.AAC.1
MLAMFSQASESKAASNCERERKAARHNTRGGQTGGESEGGEKRHTASEPTKKGRQHKVARAIMQSRRTARCLAGVELYCSSCSLQGALGCTSAAAGWHD